MTSSAPNPAPLADEVRRLLEATPVRPPIYEGTPEEARAEQDRRLLLRAPGPEMASVRDVMLDRADGQVPIRVYRPSNAPPLAIIVYFHGGGWVMGSVDDSDAHVRRVAEATGSVVISVDYRLAPEHPFPAAIDDALTAWNWALAHREELASPGTPLAIAGESAGGNIAAGITIALRDTGLPLPAFQILGYPVTSAKMNSASYHDQVDGPVLAAADMRWFWQQYAPAPATRDDPRASPLEAPDLSGLPPALVLTAECDPLCVEGEAYADRLGQAGVDARYIRYPGMVHGFYRMADLLEGGRAALADVGAFVRDQVRSMPDRQRQAADIALD